MEEPKIGVIMQLGNIPGYWRITGISADGQPILQRITDSEAKQEPREKGLLQRLGGLCNES